MVSKGRMINIDKYQSELKQKSLLSVIDKSRAINLRLSAFICGLKFNKPRQPNFIKKLKNQLILFVKQASAFICFHLRLIKIISLQRMQKFVSLIFFTVIDTQFSNIMN